MTDKERMDWLQKIAETGYCPGIIHDDNGGWAVTFSGVQSTPDKDGFFEAAFFIEGGDVYPTLREAIDAAYESEKGGE